LDKPKDFFLEKNGGLPTFLAQNDKDLPNFTLQSVQLLEIYPSFRPD